MNEISDKELDDFLKNQVWGKRYAGIHPIYQDYIATLEGGMLQLRGMATGKIILVGRSTFVDVLGGTNEFYDELMTRLQTEPSIRLRANPQ